MTGGVVYDWPTCNHLQTAAVRGRWFYTNNLLRETVPEFDMRSDKRGFANGALMRSMRYVQCTCAIESNK